MVDSCTIVIVVASPLAGIFKISWVLLIFLENLRIFGEF
jgi:hypothetical protein